MSRGDLGMLRPQRLSLRYGDRAPSATGKTGIAARAIQHRLTGRPRNEALLRGLFGHPHALADLGPGGARFASLIDEVADEVVSKLTEPFGGENRIGEVIERAALWLVVLYVCD